MDVPVTSRVERGTLATLPTQWGEFVLIGYRDTHLQVEHVAALNVGTATALRLTSEESSSPAGAATNPVRVRVHSECLTGDIFGSFRCDCGPQLQAALRSVAERGGMVLYLRGHEGRGVGLLNKLAAYRLQEQGVDTVDAQTELGLPVDAREYGAAAAMLQDLGVTEVTLLTNNPDKIAGLTDLGIQVRATERVVVGGHPANRGYLATKRDRMGHHLPGGTIPAE